MRRGWRPTELHDSGSPVLPAERRDNGAGHRNQNNASHDGERKRGGDLEPCVIDQHFDPDEDEDDGQADLEISEIINGPRQNEIERTEAEDGKHIRGKNDVGVLGHPENGGDRIHGEDQVGRFHGEQDQRQRRQGQAAIQAGKELLPFEVRSHRKKPSRQADDRVLLRMHFLLGRKNHAHSGKDQKNSQDIEHPFELLDQLHSDPDHDAPHDEGSEDSPKEDPMLKFLRQSS